MICVVFLFLCVVRLKDGVRNIGFCNMFRLRIYVTKCKQELEFLWKSNVVMGSYGLKNLRGKRKANGFKRKIIAV